MTKQRLLAFITLVATVCFAHLVYAGPPTTVKKTIAQPKPINFDEKQIKEEDIENFPGAIIVQGHTEDGVTTLQVRVNPLLGIETKIEAVEVRASPSQAFLAAFIDQDAPVQEMMAAWKDHPPRFAVQTDFAQSTPRGSFAAPEKGDEGFLFDLRLHNLNGEPSVVQLGPIQQNQFKDFKFAILTSADGMKVQPLGETCFWCSGVFCGCAHCKTGSPTCCCTQSMFCEITCYPIMCLP